MRRSFLMKVWRITYLGLFITISVALGEATDGESSNDSNERRQIGIALPFDIELRFNVTGPYDACRTREDRQETIRLGQWFLAKRSGCFGWVPIVRDMKQFVAREQFILGTTATGFFIIDTLKGEDTENEASLFSEKDEWEAALNSQGVPTNLILNSPDEIASGRSPIELRPWKYTKLKGFMGLSDDAWVGIVILAAYAGSLLVGIFLRGNSWVFLSGLAGFAAGFWGDMIALEGPMIGMIGMPITCVVLCYIGRFIRRVLLKSVRRANQPGS